MPAPSIEKFAKESGKSKKEVEKLWNKAKKIVSKEYPKIKEKNPRFWKLTTGIVKKMLKLDESKHEHMFDILVESYSQEGE
jgi:hypothetical protein